MRGAGVTSLAGDGLVTRIGTCGNRRASHVSGRLRGCVVSSAPTGPLRHSRRRGGPPGPPAPAGVVRARRVLWRSANGPRDPYEHRSTASGLGDTRDHRSCASRSSSTCASHQRRPRDPSSARVGQETHPYDAVDPADDAVRADLLIRPARFVSLVRPGASGALRARPLTRAAAGEGRRWCRSSPGVGVAVRRDPPDAPPSTHGRPHHATRPRRAVHPSRPRNPRRRVRIRRSAPTSNRAASGGPSSSESTSHTPPARPGPRSRRPGPCREPCTGSSR